LSFFAISSRVKSTIWTEGSSDGEIEEAFVAGTAGGFEVVTEALGAQFFAGGSAVRGEDHGN
jgi:hypothetical protein